MTVDENIRNLISRTESLSDAEVRKAMKILENTQKQIASRLVATDWDAYRIPEMQKAVTESMNQFRDKYIGSLTGAVSESFSIGGNMIAPGAITAISQSNLELLQGYSADRITNMTSEMIAQINDEIAMGVTGGKTLQEVMKAIGNNLDDPGVFRTIAGRAETIARTEIAVVNSNARESRIQEVMRSNPDRKYKKTWIHSGKAPNHSRKNHKSLNMLTIPINMDFSYMGLRTPVPPGMGMKYPHAPGLPAKEVVNCGCVHVLEIGEATVSERRTRTTPAPTPKPVPAPISANKSKPEKIFDSKVYEENMDGKTYDYDFEKLIKENPDKEFQLNNNRSIWGAINSRINDEDFIDKFIEIYAGDTVSAVAVYTETGNFIYIDYLATNPENIVGEGIRGAGTSAISKIAKDALKKDMEHIKLTSIQGAEEFYKKLGFKKEQYQNFGLDKKSMEKLVKKAEEKRLI